MKPPPLLLGAALLFWGWQSDFLAVGAAMALAVEGARLLKMRWEFSDDDFSRMWTLCTLLFLLASIYAFSISEGPSSFSSLFLNPTPAAQRVAGTSSARAAASLFRWLPMIIFPFILVQAVSAREQIPLHTVSRILRRRWRNALRAGMPAAAGPRSMNVGYPYFAVCLFSSSVHAADNASFFWGISGLLAWALWPQRSQRYNVAVWAVALLAAVGLGYASQRGLAQMQSYIEKLDPQWFSMLARRGFDASRNKTSIGRIGELKASGRIVIRLEAHEGSTVPTYLREASYRTNRGANWLVGDADSETVPEEKSSSGTWLLVPEKTNTSVVNIACYLEGVRNGDPAGLLPLPGGSGRLDELAAYLVEKNRAGAVFAQGLGLVIFDARFGPGEMMDAPPDPGLDLGVHENEHEVLDEIISELGLENLNTEEKLRAVSSFFAENFTYSTYQPQPRRRVRGSSALESFLMETRAGHCEYFATATALLLRRAGVPTRYAVGYYVHESSGNKYVVRLRDAHAWCLVWDESQQMWRDFDTTPPSWIDTESRRASAFQWLGDVWSRIKFEIAKVRWGNGQLRRYLLWVLLPALAILLYRIVFRRGRRRQLRKDTESLVAADWPGLDSEFYELEHQLADRGVPRASGETLSDWLLRVLDTPGLTDLRRPLQDLLALHYRYRFDPEGLNAADRAALKREARNCLDALARAKQTARQ